MKLNGSIYISFSYQGKLVFLRVSLDHSDTKKRGGGSHTYSPVKGDRGARLLSVIGLWK